MGASDSREENGSQADGGSLRNSPMNLRISAFENLSSNVEEETLGSISKVPIPTPQISSNEVNMTHLQHPPVEHEELNLGVLSRLEFEIVNFEELSPKIITAIHDASKF